MRSLWHSRSNLRPRLALAIVLLAGAFAPLCRGLSLETVDRTNAGGGLYADLALDGLQKPHLVYFDEALEKLSYSKRDTSGWTTESIPAEGTFGLGLRLQMDAAGRPHVVFHRFSLPYPQVVYTYWDGQRWHEEEVAAADNWGVFTSFILDPLGRAHIVTTRTDDATGEEQVLYLFRVSGQWKEEIVLSGNGLPGMRSSLRIDSSGEPHLLFSLLNDPLAHATQGQLLYFRRSNGGVWSHSVIQSAGTDSDWQYSLALDSSDAPHLSYSYREYPVSGGGWHYRLNYARFDPERSSWEVRDLARETSHHTLFNTLRLDNRDRPHVLYFYGSTRDRDTLRYVHRSESGWSTTTLGSDRRINSRLAMAVDSHGSPHLSFFDWNEGALLYAVPDPAEARSAVDAYFPRSIDAGNGWHYSEWLGYFAPAHFPWVWIPGIGWMYCGGRNSDHWWSWTLYEELGWLYSRPAFYPQFYSMGLNRWIWIEPGNENQLIYYDFEAKRWVSLTP